MNSRIRIHLNEKSDPDPKNWCESAKQKGKEKTPQHARPYHTVDMDNSDI